MLSAKETARATQSYAQQALPGVRKIYSGATDATNATQQDVATAFGNLGGAADVFKAATAREQGGARSRITEAAARAEQDLKDRATGAIAGRALALGEARRSYRSNLGTLSSKLTDIAGLEGSEIAARLGQLRSESLERGNRRDVARIGAESRESVAAADRASREKIAADKAKDKAGPGGVKRASAERIEKFSDKVREAMGVADALKVGGDDRRTAAPKLVHGTTIPAGTKPDPKTGEIPRPVPKFGQLVASIALDMAHDGHISRQNARRLHELGYKVSDVQGLVSTAEHWRKHPPPPPRERPPGGAWARP